MGSEIQNPFIQMSSIGLLWITFHCLPMCGPIVGSLSLSATKSASLSQLLLYQAGRGLIYAILGALAGFFGSRIPSASWMGFFIAGFLFILALLKWKPSLQISIPPNIFQTLGRLSQKFQGGFRSFWLGILFAFLPCMLTGWALSLAALTKSAMNGALLMMYLILLTSLPLYFAIIGGHFIKSKSGVATLALFLSSLWTFLMTAASMDWISHQALSFKIFGNLYTLMFW